MNNLRTGSCSWKYDSWKGIIYSEDPDINYLAEYSQHYNTVEVDQWFWSLFEGSPPKMPNERVVRNYVGSVPEEFKFSVKVPNSITLTHYYNRDKKAPLKNNPHFLSEELYSDFLEKLAPMKKYLGPLMFQFEYLNKKKMPSQFDFQIRLGGFIEKIRGDFKLGAEIRNPNYLNREYFEFLNEYGISHVFLQGYYMPSIVDLYDKYSEYIKNFTVIRLHGPDRKGIEEKSGGEWNKIIEPKDEELERIVEIINDLLSRKVDIYLNVNNHYEGSAPLTIRKIRDLLKDS